MHSRKKYIIVISGSIIFFTGLLLLILVYFLPIGRTDSEWGTIRQTGLPSNPEKRQWSEWTPAEKQITPAYSLCQDLTEKKHHTRIPMRYRKNLTDHIPVLPSKIQIARWQYTTCPCIRPKGLCNSKF